jgi:hypothetical protein
MIITPEDFFPFIFKVKKNAFIDWDTENPKIKARGEIEQRDEEHYSKSL